MDLLRIGLHRRDVGSVRLSWSELKLFIQYAGTDSAFYRAKFPKSHQWDVQTEFLSAILNVLQWANWQRGGGKSEKPEWIKRPVEDEIIDLEVSIADRKAAHDNEIQRRREARGKRSKTRMEARVG